MADRALEDQIDRLYQLPLADFTRERNALAGTLGGGEGKRVKALAKPSLAAWAANQLYWRDRKTYEALTTAAERLRAAHRAVLGGRKADLRQADADHRAAVKAALSATLQLASELGQKISPAAHTEVSQSLERLPADEAPGRLTKPLEPRGFEALQGMPVRPANLRLVPRRVAEPERDTPEREEAAPRPSKSEIARARREEQRARQEEQRARRAAREKEKRARAELARLQKALADAERETAVARRAWEKAQEAEEKARTALRGAMHTTHSN